MKFILGLLTGLVLGAVGTVAYSLQSGRDLREAFDEVRSDLDQRDFEALGTRLEARVSELQTRLEERIAQVRDRAGTTDTEVEVVAVDAGAGAADAVETVQAAVEEQTGA
jgi:gas vesicle protein